MEAYLRFIERAAPAIIAVLAVATAFFALQLFGLVNDSNPYLLKPDHPARRGILELQQRFTGTFDAVLVTVESPTGVFQRPTLQALHTFTAASRKLLLADDSDARQLRRLAARHGTAITEIADGILANGLEQNDYFAALALRDRARGLALDHDERAFIEYLPFRLNPIKKIAGVAASENILSRDGVLVVRTSLESPETSPEQVRDEVMGNAMMAGGIVSADERVAMAIVELGVRQEDAEGQMRAYLAFQNMVSDYRAAHPEFTDTVYIAGVPIFIAEQKKLIDRDMATLFPLVVGIIGVILIAYFRKPLGFLLPMLNVTMCTVWTLGMMSLLKIPLDIITSVLPVFLITICGADAIHMMNEYYTQRAQGLAPKPAAAQMLRIMASPVVLTTVTTVAGFLVATSTKLSSIRHFGLFMAIGLVTAQLISLLLIPACLGLTRARAVTGRTRSEDESGGWLGALLCRWFAYLLPRRAPVLAVFGVLIALAAGAASRINVEDAGAEYFSADNPFRQADEFVNAHLAGTSPGWIEIRAGAPGEILSTAKVEFIDELDSFLASQPKITYTYSLAKYIKRMNYVLHDMNPAFDRLPLATEWMRSPDSAADHEIREPVSGDALVQQAVLMYENGGGQDLSNVLNPDGSAAVTMFTMNTTRATEYRQLLGALNAWLKAHRPSGLAVEVTGTPVIWSGVLDEIVRGQVLSIALALTTVTIVLMLWLRSVRLGLLTALPLAVTIVLYYAVMSLAGIDLNIGTAIISFLVVGIVDYSVHYLHRIRHGLDRGQSLDQALLYALRHSGRSIAFNVVLFSLGFLALLASEFTPIFHLGVLVALALSISGAMSLFLISMLAPWFIPQAVAEPSTAARSRALWPADLSPLR